MKRNILIFISLVAASLFLIIRFSDKTEYNLQKTQLRQKFIQPEKKVVDHSNFESLQKEFDTPQEVTLACIECHNKRHEEIMSSAHWNWERAAYVEGKGISFLGKKNIVNNFCTGATSNELACMACHIGFGMTDNQFDFENAQNVDCMVCHDNSHEYKKGSGMAGYPDRNVNLANVAQSVGDPQSHNCGVCHFYGGGGNNVKHGDLDVALLSTTREVDVHMAANGVNMTCTDCHDGKNHDIKGRLYSVSSENTNRLHCEDCHTNTPHFSEMINKHTSRIACQTCHIPKYAKENATKMEWYWSEAGKMDENGEPYSEEDSLGNHTYLSKKGRFRWERNVKPDYVWFNGTADHHTVSDSITSDTVYLNKLNGSYSDKNSKIIPVKIHKGDQIYDTKFKNIIQPKVYSVAKGDSGYWKDFDWIKAAEAGMKRMGLPFSGEYGFIPTKMYWPVNHMVAPADQALSCADCHTRHDGRLEELDDFYLPGRDHHAAVDLLGWLLIGASLAGVAFHTALRVWFSKKQKR
jgi:octaheme c-type cytochrome (tetrathionate reductase family)